MVIVYKLFIEFRINVLYLEMCPYMDMKLPVSGYEILVTRHASKKHVINGRYQ